MQWGCYKYLAAKTFPNHGAREGNYSAVKGDCGITVAQVDSFILPLVKAASHFLKHTGHTAL